MLDLDKYAPPPSPVKPTCPEAYRIVAYSSSDIQVRYTGAGKHYSHEIAEQCEAEYRAWLQARRAIRQENSDIRMTFKADLLESLSLTDHPKAQRLWEMAWDHGHSAGLSEVVDWAETLAELVQ
jgi:hypothetical protein